MHKPEIVLLSGNDIFANDLAAVVISKMLFDHGKRSNIIHMENVLQFICMDILRGGEWNFEASNPGECFWMDYILPYLEKFYDRWDFVIFPDLKFEDEINLLVREDYKCYLLWILNDEYNDNWIFENYKPNFIIKSNSNREIFSNKVSALVGSILLEEMRKSSGHF